MKLEMTLKQLEQLLTEQKKITIEKLRGQTAYYNKDSTDGHMKTLPINEDKFLEAGMAARFPDDYTTLIRYLKD